MRTRVEKLLEMDCRKMWISTFHALCARLLRREAPHVGLSRDFVIYDSNDQLSVVKQGLKALGIDDSATQPRMVLSRISHAKNRMEGPEVFESSWNPRDQHLGKLYAMYTKALKDARALDFDDLLLYTVELVEKSENVRRKYAEQFRYVMVDEYQDTNRPQYLLIQRLASVHRNLAVVGDPDQSIYKWRGADLRNILDFEHDFPEALVVRLERNYRSTQVILDAASAVIAQNKNRKEKRLYTEQVGGARILYYRAGDDLDEAEYIARTCRQALREDGDNLAAVLYRTNAQSRTVEDALRRAGISYRIIGGVRFYERQRGQGRAVVPAAGAQPARRRQPAPGDQRAGARDRQGRDGIARGGRGRTRRRPAAAARRPAAGRQRHLALGQAHAGGRTAAVGTAGRDRAGRLPRPARRADGRGGGGAVGGASPRQGARPQRLSQGPARGAQRRSRGAHREPDGARLGRARVREPGARAVAGRVRRSAVTALGRGRGGRLQGQPRADDDDAQRQGARVPGRHHRRPGGGPVSAFALGRRRGRARGGAAAVLRRHHARAAPSGADVGGAPARVRGLPEHGAVAVHRRDSAEPDGDGAVGDVVVVGERLRRASWRSLVGLRTAQEGRDPNTATRTRTSPCPAA